MLTCVLLHPFCFFGLDSNTALIALEGKRARHVNPIARGLGVVEGMLETAVRLKAPQVQLVPVLSPALLERWSEMLESLHIFSPNVEGPREGIAFLTARASDALHLAGEYGARLGRGETQELALLAAQGAEQGKVLSWPKDGTFRAGPLEVASGQRREFLERCPMSTLELLGLETRTLERFIWLGLKQVGALYGWNKAQLGGFFGREARLILNVLYEGTPRVARYRAAQKIRAVHTPFETLHEPFQLEPILEKLAGQLSKRLEGKLACRLVLSVDTPLGQLGDVTTLKEKSLEAKVLYRALKLTLERTGAMELGVDKLEATLTDLFYFGEQRGLFETRPSVCEAVEQVHRRFPGALLRVVPAERFSQAREQRFSLIPWQPLETSGRPGARGSRGR